MLKQLAFIFSICVYVWYMKMYIFMCVHVCTHCMLTFMWKSEINAGHFVTYSVPVLFIYALTYLFVCLTPSLSVNLKINSS